MTSDLMPQIVKDLKALSDAKGMTMQLDYTLLLGGVWTIVQGNPEGAELRQRRDRRRHGDHGFRHDLRTRQDGRRAGYCRREHRSESFDGDAHSRSARIMNGKVEFEWLPAPTPGS